MAEQTYRVTITEVRAIKAEWQDGANPLEIEQAVCEAAADLVLAEPNNKRSWTIGAKVEIDPDAKDYHPHAVIRMTQRTQYEVLPE